MASSLSFGSQITKSFRLLCIATLNKLNYMFRTGNMKFAFERMYLENRDPWNYQSSAYERKKYERTLSCALTWRRASVSALEIGCSIGIFSGMLAEHFDKVTAIDVSKEALRLAIVHNRYRHNIEFDQSDLRTLALGEQYDVICCAEVFYYIRERDAGKVCRRLAQHLAPNGVIIFVAGTAGHNPIPFCWEAILATYQQVFRQIVADPVRPYEIGVFSRKDDPT
ncbi:Nodulation protein S (NodS) [Rhizobiales bacterium GAS113]|nr:Nodulation protein S (NodS) [Rhizobiales bacterium GAS113]